MFQRINRLLFPTPDAPRSARVPQRAGAATPAAGPVALPPALDNWLSSLPRYDPLTRRQRRLWVPVLGLGTSLFILYMMFERPGAPPPELGLLPPLPAVTTPPEAAPRCAPGQTRGCVGGRAEVLLIAPAPAPARPEPSAARP